MKLLFCPICTDIVKLDYAERSCKCGRSSGFYHKDGWHATVSGEAVCLGIHNPDFAKAYGIMRDGSELTAKEAFRLLGFRAWVFHPKHAERVEYKQ